MRIDAKKLEEAIKIAECISVDYEDADEEEIAQIDDALDIIFRVAREKLKELKNNCLACKNYDNHTSGEFPCAECKQIAEDYFEAKEAEK